MELGTLILVGSTFPAAVWFGAQISPFTSSKFTFTWAYGVSHMAVLTYGIVVPWIRLGRYWDDIGIYVLDKYTVHDYLATIFIVVPILLFLN